MSSTAHPAQQSTLCFLICKTEVMIPESQCGWKDSLGNGTKSQAPGSMDCGQRRAQWMTNYQ